MDLDAGNEIIFAVNEAAANVIEYNYEKDPLLEGREVLIETGLNGKTCFFRIYCDGEDYEWTTIQAPD